MEKYWVSLSECWKNKEGNKYLGHFERDYSSFFKARCSVRNIKRFISRERVLPSTKWDMEKYKTILQRINYVAIRKEEEAKRLKLATAF